LVAIYNYTNDARIHERQVYFTYVYAKGAFVGLMIEQFYSIQCSNSIQGTGTIAATQK